MKTNIAVVLLLALFLASLTGIAAGQSPERPAEVTTKGGHQFSPQTYFCAFNFSAGSGYDFISFCLTGTGNVLQIATPDGRPQIADGYEGYGICNESPAQAYDDWGPWGNSANWGAVNVLNESATSVKLARTTKDGIWTLTQTFTLVPSTPAAKIVMALTNNTSAPRVAYLVRYGDIDADYRNYGNLLNNSAPQLRAPWRGTPAFHTVPITVTGCNCRIWVSRSLVTCKALRGQLSNHRIPATLRRTLLH